MALEFFKNFITTRTEDTTPDLQADLMLTYDSSAGTTKKVKLANLFAQSLGRRVRAATTANITISTALNNADTLDGVTLATGDLVLVKDQSSALQNGIYVVGASPARAVDFDTYDEHAGAVIYVNEGTTNADTLWKCTSNAGGTLNTTAITFAAAIVAGYTPGGTDVAVADGGTGSSTAAGALTNLGAMPAADVLRSYLATTVTYNNTAALASTALSVSVAASTKYDIELTIHSTSAGAGLNMDFAGTATITNFIGQWTAWQAAIDESGPTRIRGDRTTAAGTDFGPVGVDGIDSFYTFKGSVEINGAGTFLLRGAQTSAAPSDTTILRGSTLILTKLA